MTCELNPPSRRDEFAAAADNNNGSVELGRQLGPETDPTGGACTGATGGFVWITPGQLQFRSLLATVGDQFASAAYNLNTGTVNWTDNWTEEPASLDDSPVGTPDQQIYITGGRLRFDRATGSNVRHPQKRRRDGHHRNDQLHTQSLRH